MSDEQRTRTRQEVDLLREGYMSAANEWGVLDMAQARKRATELFPYPKRTVPNVVRDNERIEWYVEGGNLMSEGSDGAGWCRVVVWGTSALDAIREVLNQPTIEVEDDGNE